MPDPVVNPPRPPLWKRWGPTVNKWLVYPLIGALIGAVVIGRFVNWLMRPEMYRVYIVGNFQPGSPANDLRYAFVGQSPALGTLDGVPVQIHFRSDDGDLDRARLIAASLAAESDTLMVIGHLSSTRTQAALPIYLHHSNPPVPVLLTTETNPNLLPRGDAPGDAQEDLPVLRLAPTDDRQAALAVCLAGSGNTGSIAVVEGGENPVYSRYLAREFMDQSSPGAAKVVFWSSSIGGLSLADFRVLGIRSVFYAGDQFGAAILARQLRAVYKGADLPRVILSDSAMNAKLLSQAGTDLEGMLLTLPLSFARYHSGKGYAVYGADARAVVQSLLLWTQNDFDSLAARGRRIRRTFNALLGLRRVGDARNALGNCIRQAKLEHQLQVNGQPVPVSKEGRVNADYSQDKSNGGFHVWQVKRAGEGYDFTDADQAYANCLGTTAGEQTSSRHIVASVRGNPQDVN